MNLKDLLACLISDCSGVPSLEIQELTEDSRRCHASSLFVCIEGYRSDGHQYALNAYQKGCRAFVAQKTLKMPDDAYVLLVDNTRNALGLLACRFYDTPSRKIPVIGITGTKGKTTVACMIRSILEQNQIPCGYIGTNGIQFGNHCEETNNTTPDAVTLQKSLANMIENGCRAVVLEVSSQALLLERVVGMKFFCAVYTNLFFDHIGEGEHRDFEDYKNCKRRLFTDFEAERMVYNISDRYADEMQSASTSPKKITCSIDPGKSAEYCIDKIIPVQTASELGSSFYLTHQNKKTPCFLPMIGDCNVLNGLLAAAVAKEVFDISIQNTAETLKNIQIAGRSEVIPLKNGALAVIDYAHNGESLRQLLSNLKRFHPKRLITLFGSVGDRTEIRRRELGLVAAEYSDLCILTSDNPGKEDPQKILNEIADAVSLNNTPYRCIIDRAEAIAYAVEIAESGDILVLAGKGHETYQLIGLQKIPFSETEILLSAEKSMV